MNHHSPHAKLLGGLGLTREERLVVMLRHADQLRVSEAAAVLGVGEPRVRMIEEGVKQRVRRLRSGSRRK